MSRRREVAKREIIADAKYGSRDIAKFVNVVMKSGKKSVAERIVYGALAEVEKKTKRDPAEVLAQAVENVRPQVEVKSRRVGGANYQVPVEVRASRGVALAMRWLRRAMREGAEKAPTSQRLARELLEAVEGRGAAVKKRDEVHRMAAANKAFSHFRF